MVLDTEQASEMLPCPVTRRGRVWDTLPKRSDFLRLSASRLRRVTPGFILQCAPRIPQAAPRTEALLVGQTPAGRVSRYQNRLGRHLVGHARQDAELQRRTHDR